MDLRYYNISCTLYSSMVWLYTGGEFWTVSFLGWDAPIYQKSIPRWVKIQLDNHPWRAILIDWYPHMIVLIIKMRLSVVLLLILITLIHFNSSLSLLSSVFQSYFITFSSSSNLCRLSFTNHHLLHYSFLIQVTSVGLWGLWLGGSLLTIFEIMDLFGHSTVFLLHTISQETMIAIISWAWW